jgi:putative transposase
MINEKGTYMVTAATHHKEILFKEENDLDYLQNLLLDLAQRYTWNLEAWAIFANHYHFIAHSSDNPSSLRKLITHLHAASANHLNKKHNTPGRKVWYQFWDTRITFQKSYLARLNYVLQNPVKHGLAKQAIDYPWSSVNWFKTKASPAHYKTVMSMKTDKVKVVDDF